MKRFKYSVSSPLDKALRASPLKTSGLNPQGVTPPLKTLEDNIDQKEWRITWDNKNILYKHYCWVYNNINCSRDYFYSGYDGNKSISKRLSFINNKINSDITLDQYISIRDMIIKQKIMDKHNIMKQFIHLAYRDYQNGMKIIDISIKHDASSSRILKEIFLMRGYGPHLVKQLFNKGITDEITPYFYPYDLHQFNSTWEKDIDSMKNQKKVANIAQKNETIFVDFFRNLGIRCKTQDDLVEEQMLTDGRAVSTPDILFLDAVYINDVRVFWIDFKNYSGIDATFFFKSNGKQATRYNKLFGPGAICYNYSFVSGMHIQDTLLLDGSALELVYQS